MAGCDFAAPEKGRGFCRADNNASDADHAVKRLGRGVMLGYLSLACSALLGALLTPFVARAVGPEHYGIWILVSSVIGYISLLDLGLSYGVTRYTARLEILSQQKALNELVSSAFTAYCLLATVAAAVILLTCWRAGSWLHIPPSDVTTAQVVLVILGAQSCIGLPLTLLAGILRGYQRFSFLSFANIATSLTSAGIIVLLIGARADITGLAACAMLTSLGRCALHWMYVRKKLPALRISLRSPIRAGQLLRYGGTAFIVTVCAQVAFASDAIVVGSLLSVGAVAVYGVAQKLIEALTAAVFQGIDALFPLLTQLDAHGQSQKVRAVFQEAVTIGLGLVIPFIICLVAFGDRILDAWAGPLYTSGYTVLIALSFALLFNVPGHVAAIVLLSLNKHRGLAIISVFDALANLALSIALVKTHGLVGVALGTTVTMLVSSSLIVPGWTCHILQLHPWSYVRDSILPVFVSSLAPAVAALALLAVPGPTGLLGLVYDVSVTLSVAAPSFWYIALRATQRARYRHHIASIFAIRSDPERTHPGDDVPMGGFASG